MSEHCGMVSGTMSSTTRQKEMNILAIIGSSKVGGNTEQLTDAFLRGAAENGHTVVKFHLGQHTIHPCLGCNSCSNGNVCAQKDDMQTLYTEFLRCDLLVLATPLYFWGISAQLKSVIDRLYALGVPSPKGYFEYPSKKVVLLATAADSQNHFWTFELVEQYYRRFVHYMRWSNLGVLTVGSCGGTLVERRIQHTHHLGHAYEFGKRVTTTTDPV